MKGGEGRNSAGLESDWVVSRWRRVRCRRCWVVGWRGIQDVRMVVVGGLRDEVEQSSIGSMTWWSLRG